MPNYYNENMARPRKDKSLLMSAKLVIMMTEEQKALMDKAAKIEVEDTSSWARPILAQAAQDVIDGQKRRQK